MELDPLILTSATLAPLAPWIILPSPSNLIHLNLDYIYLDTTSLLVILPSVQHLTLPSLPIPNDRCR